VSRFRLATAALVAVAMMSLGAAACTPEQDTLIGTGIANLITFILFIHVYGDPLGFPVGSTTSVPTTDTTPTTPPVTDPPVTQPPDTVAG
jgi:hypothetical protein